jgi:O-antigen/teichoic acid export membrane protein
MKATRDLLAGVLNSVWSALVGFAVVPLYLRYLGIEAYGLIGFFATTQALLQLLDMGLAPTVNREVARHVALGNPRGAGALLHTLTWVYWSVAVVIAIGSYAFAPWVAEHWLHSKALTPQALRESVALLGFVVACRWPIGLYQGVLMGAHRLATASAINMVMATMSALGAVLVLAFVSATVQAFFVWQAAMGLLYALAMRHAAWRALGGATGSRFDVEQIRRVWRFSAGMSGVAISAIVLMQLDKVLLSRILTLDGFGQYALAGVVASALYILLTPTFNVIYPRLSALVAQGNGNEVARLYRNGTRLLTAVLFPIAAGASVFSYELLLLWTGNPEVARHSSPVVSLFLIGTALNGAMHFPYALQLAYGHTRLPLLINGILLVVLVPLITVLALRFGAVGGAASWALLNTVYLLVGTWLTHRSLLRGVGLRWLARDVLAPLGVAALVVGVAGEAMRRLPLSPLAMLFLATVLVTACALALLAASPHGRNVLAQAFSFCRALGTPFVSAARRSR